MKDYIGELCRNYNIKLSYIDDDSIILTGSTQSGVPTIILHKMFKNCPEDIANAVINYCKGHENKNDFYMLIENYAKENLYSLEYIIEPPDEKFEALLKQNVYQKDPDKQPVEKAKKNDLHMDEMEVTSITYQDFWGNVNEMSPNSSIKTSNDDVINLDITIDGYPVDENEQT